MSSFLLHGRSDCDIDLNDEARRNVLWLLHVTEGLMYILEHPNDSFSWLELEKREVEGIKPSDTVLPKIIQKHFQMSVTDFFTETVEDEVFVAFEKDCHQSCASLNYFQIRSVYNRMRDLEAYSSL